MRHWVSLNGTLMPADQARVSVFDSGFMQGIGLFETLRAYDGHIFRLQRHLDRLIQSAGKLGWTVLPDPDDLAENIRQVMSAVGDPDARLRLTVTTGSLHAEGDETPDLTIVATAGPAQKYPEEFYTRGVTALISTAMQAPHDPIVGHKTTSYFARLASLRAAHAQSAFEALWQTPDATIAQGALSNLFAVSDEVLMTPPLDTPVLPGITRATVLELAAQENIPVREQPLNMEELLGAEEVFLTSSMFEIVPVVRIGRQAIGMEKVGEITRRLIIAYGHLIDREAAGE